MERSAPAVCHKSEVARIEAALERNMPDHIGHCRSGHLQHSFGCALQTDVEGTGQTLAQSGFCGNLIEPHLTAEKTLGGKPSKNDVRISNSGLAATPSVARWTGFCTGAPRPNVQPAAFIKPCDAAAAGPHLDNIEDRDANREAFIVAADKIIR